MLDTTELVHSLTSPPASSLDTPIASDNLPVTNLSSTVFQDWEDLDDDLDDIDIPDWEDDTVD